MDDTERFLNNRIDSEFECFFKEHQRKLYRIVLGYLHKPERADEAVLDTYYKIYRKWDKIKLMDNPAGYLIRTGINTACSYLRKNRRKDLLLYGESEDQFSNDDNPENTVLFKEQFRQIENLILGLKDTERNVILLRHIEGLSFKEIASDIGKKESTVRSLYYRTLKKLGRRLEEEGIEL